MDLNPVLDVDLSTGVVTKRPVDPDRARLVLGGRGLVALELLDRHTADPLSPENPLLVFAGLLTGTSLPSSARVHVGARSPLTGLSGSSNIGGRFGRALRRAGVSGLVVRGAARRPSYLLVSEDGAEVLPAGELWGCETALAGGTLARTHPRSSSLLIGPAGERAARLACIVTEHGHAAGRTGMGAVMGSKRLKAIVVVPPPAAAAVGGRSRSPATQRDDRRAVARAAAQRYLTSIASAPSFPMWQRWGATASVSWCDERGILATRNFATATFEGAAATDGTALDPWLESTHGCPGCPVRCKAELRLRGRFVERPDFEPLVAWGAKVGVDDPEAVVLLHERCDQLGLDSVSAGAVCAFAIDLFERGIIDEADTGGLVLRWGAVESLMALLEQMGSGEGFGGLLADGVLRAAAVIGRGAKRWAYHVKGLELTAYDPRGAFATALGYAVSNRGADYAHVYARHEFDVTTEAAVRLYGDRHAAQATVAEGKAEMVRRSMIVSAVLDALGICKVPALSLINAYDLEAEAELASAATGVELSAGDLWLAGERIVVAERLFNLACGARAADDMLPPLFTSRPLTEGPSRGVTMPIEAMVRDFYRRMGWSRRGRPTKATLERLQLPYDRRGMPPSSPARSPVVQPSPLRPGATVPAVTVSEPISRSTS
jgi:aldehyde:ferredoxin oxidoreductase